MSRILGAALILSVPSFTLAQTAHVPEARNSLYVELLGNAGALSVNFERELTPHWSLRVGAGSWDNTGTYISTRYITLPVLVNYRLGTGSSALELGGGLLLGQRRHTGQDQTASSFHSLTASAGYRYQPPRGGPLLRAGFTPFYSLDPPDRAYPGSGFSASIGLSLGYAF